MLIRPWSAQDTIIRLLYSLGSRHEVERYLRIFTSSSTAAAGKSGGVLPEAKFAVLKWVVRLKESKTGADPHALSHAGSAVPS